MGASRKGLAERNFWRVKRKPEPWRALPPERVKAFWIPPPTRPNSAEKVVTVWNSATAS